MKTFLLLAALLFPLCLRAQIPVTDVASLLSNQLAHVENIAKWVDSISQLRTQISHLREQIDIQKDIRQWTGNPAEAGGALLLDILGANDLVRDFGRTQEAIRQTVDSVQSLVNTSSGTYRSITSVDIEGNPMQRDPLLYRRFSVLDATRENTEVVASETKARERELQEEVALTLSEIKTAPTDAEVQKLSAKLNALNGQLAQVENTRQREVDAVTIQKLANDARQEEERVAAAELAARDDYLANLRVTTYMRNVRVRRVSPDEL